ncbi:MAG: sugar phosphate isomerase/epimerase [Truepera sp.]|nr:sugar phosphate isomerase/epimerase [Truepera sp.]
MTPPRTALQLYTLRHLPGGPEAHLACAAEAGFDGVELLHGLGLEAEALRDRLAEHGLRAVSSHVALASLEADPDGVASFHRTVGTPVLIVPNLPEEFHGDSPESWQALGRRLADLGQVCRARGLRLAYHNHDSEMDLFGEVTALDLLLEAAPPDLLELELDLAWVVRGGRDPLELLARHQGRCPRVHVKDLAPAGENLEEDGWADVGHGTLDWDTLLPAAIKAGAEWFIVEHDTPTDPARTAARSYAYLASLGYR